MTFLRHLRKGDRVRVVDAKRREDLRWDGCVGRVAKDRIYGELHVDLTVEHGRGIAGLRLPLEGPNAVIVELIDNDR